MEIKNKMSDEFYNWLNQCPNQWFLETYDENSSTYLFLTQDESYPEYK